MSINARLMPRPDEVGGDDPERPLVRLSDLVYDPSADASLGASPRFTDRNLLWTDPLENPISLAKGPWVPNGASKHLATDLLIEVMAATTWL